MTKRKRQKIVIAPDDVESLTEALYQAYNEKSRLHTMAEQGYHYIQEHFGWDEIGRQVAMLYNIKQK